MVKKASRIIIAVVCLLLADSGTVLAASEPQKVMEFHPDNCEGEMARMDHLANLLRENESNLGYIIVYGGRRGTRRDEIRVVGARMRRYLIQDRGVARNRIAVVNGGFRERLTVELFLVPRGENMPAATPTVNPRRVRYRRGSARGWEEPGCFPDALPVPNAAPHNKSFERTAG